MTMGEKQGSCLQDCERNIINDFPDIARSDLSPRYVLS